MPEQYRYLIGCAIPGGTVAAVDMSFRAPIRNVEDVKTIQRQLVRQFHEPNLVILSFSQFAA